MNEPLEPSHYYHYYNRGNNKENLFFKEDNYLYFLKLIEKYLVPIADIYSYCLLPNHYHFAIRIKDKEKLPVKFYKGKSKLHQPFSNLFNAYAKAINKQYKRTGSLFQKHPKKIRIENQNYLLNLIIYINYNPTHHSISDYSTYKYSSYQSLISNNETFIKRGEVLDLFNDVNNFKYMHELKNVNIELINRIIQDD